MISTLVTGKMLIKKLPFLTERIKITKISPDAELLA